MESCNYPGFLAHKAQHALFTKKMREIDGLHSKGCANTKDLVRYLVGWFTLHISHDDTAMGEFLLKNITRETSPLEFEIR